ncbi:MAG: hypothetical protein ACYTG7_12855 [Planctomycetota bacterium]|jgi:hypothetical protein
MMIKDALKSIARTVCLALIFLAPISVVQAHVKLNAPNGGEALDVGSVFTIKWTVIIEHNTQDWDVWYSTAGSTGPWKEIAMDLPVGDPTIGSIHTYDWTVPEDISDDVYVRVRQDNLGFDYEDKSDGSLSISYLAMQASPNPASMGDTLTVDTQATTLPSELTALLLIDVSGTPLIVFLAYVPLDGLGQWSLSATVPPGLAGESLTFQTFALKPPGIMVSSNPIEIFFL